MLLAACQPSVDNETKAPINPWLESIPQSAILVAANEKALTDQALAQLVRALPPMMVLANQALGSPAHGLESMLVGFQTPADLVSIGIDPHGFWAAYNHGFEWRAHIPLTDPLAFWDWWQSKMPNHSPSATPQAIAENQPSGHRQVEMALDRVSSLIGFDSRIMLTLATDTNALHVRLGPYLDQQPDSGLDQESEEQTNSPSWSHATWSAVNQTHGFDGSFTVLVDASGLGNIGNTSIEHNLACQHQLSRFQDSAPRWIIGTQESHPNHLSLLWRSTNQPTLQQNQPQMDVSAAQHARVAGLGIAGDLPKLRDGLLQQLKMLTKINAACASDNILRTPTRLAQGLANRPIPPIVTSVHGVMSRFEGIDPTDEESVWHYHTEIYLRNPAFILGLAQLFAPDMASMDLRPNRPAERLPDALSNALSTLPIYLSTTESSIRASSTPKSWVEEENGGADSAQTREETPWLVATLNLLRLQELSQALAAGPVGPRVKPLVDALDELGQSSGIQDATVVIRPTQEGFDATLSIGFGQTETLNPQ